MNPLTSTDLKVREVVIEEWARALEAEVRQAIERTRMIMRRTEATFDEIRRHRKSD